MATEVDPHDTPEYAAFVEAQRKYCRCDVDCPCDGVLAGGMCDDLRSVDDDEPRDEPGDDE